MAGGFGYEAGEHYDVSLKAGERVLLPAVRAAAKDTLVIADGFSCRTQIAETTDRRALHLAQVVQIALRESGPSRNYPESTCYDKKPPRLGARDMMVLGAGAALIGTLAWRLASKDPR
jgi:hypothetical protein